MIDVFPDEKVDVSVHKPRTAFLNSIMVSCRWINSEVCLDHSQAHNISRTKQPLVTGTSIHAA